MKNSSSIITLFSVAVIVSLVLSSQVSQAKDAAEPKSSSLASKLIPQTKARTARSLGDMFEKVRSKIFGSRKQASASSNNQVQPAASVNVPQRQPWGDLNSFNQQYSPYSSLSSSYQWPSSSNNQYLGQQYNPLGAYASLPSGASAYPTISSSPSQSGSSLAGLDGQQQQSSLNPAANSNSAGNGGLLSSASHLIAQYLSPSSASSSSSSNAGQQQGISQSAQQANAQQGQSLLSPQQQQQQSNYNEFATILDSMVAQTGASSQRQPSLNQYLSSGPAIQNQQGISAQQQGMQGYQGSASGNILGSSSMIGDQDVSASSNIQSYMPASPQQASQKSSMVGLAEQLAPGANFNKLVSFPFSLSSNDDPSKEGRYKLHIPFLNQHVKRSDPQVSNTAAIQQQQQQRAQQQQYLNSYYNQQQQQHYAASLANQQAQQQQQLLAQSSQVAPTIVSPQSSVIPQQSSAQQSSSSSQIASSNSPVLASSGVNSSQQSSAVSSSISSSSSSVPQSSSSSLLSSPNNSPSASSSVSAQSNSRPTWSVADLQSSSSNSKLIPMQSSASSSSVDSASSSQS